MTENVITPLEGEQVIPDVAPRPKPSRLKYTLALTLLVFSLLAAVAFGVTKIVDRFRGAPKVAAAPDIASSQGTRLNMPAEAPRAASVPASPASSVGNKPTVPSIQELPDRDEPITVRGQGGSQNGGQRQTKVVDPDDAPLPTKSMEPPPGAISSGGMRTVSTQQQQGGTSNYQQQVAGLMENLQRMTGGATGAGAPSLLQTATARAGGAPPAGATPALFGMEQSATPRAYAQRMQAPEMTVPIGRQLLCPITVRIVSATSGFVTCKVMRTVYSRHNIPLIDKGAEITGEFRLGSVKPGMTRIPIIASLLRNPDDVEIKLDSVAVGPLGEPGVGGYVDNRWPERVGAALILALSSDAVKAIVLHQQNGDNNGTGNTVVMPTTTDQGPKLAEKVLDSTINIPPLLYKNQGELIGIFVSRDLDFSTVYQLVPTGR